MLRFFGYLLIIGFIVFTGMTMVTMVNPGERAVIRRFGEVLDYKPGPGLYVGFPWGIDRVDRVEVDKVRSVQIGFSPEMDDDLGMTIPPGQLLTGDHNVVNIQAIIDFTVNPDEVVDFIYQQDQAEALVARTAETVMTKWVAARTVDKVLLEGKISLLDIAGGIDPQQMPLPDVLVKETNALLKPFRLGVIVQKARITHLNPPSEVKDAFEEVTRAEMQIKEQEYKALQYKVSHLRTAEGNANQILRYASAYAREKILLAQADAENFNKRLEQYRRLKKANPYYLNAIWWDEMSRLYRRMKDNGRLDLLDHHLGQDGLDITQIPKLPKNRSK